MQQFYLSQNIFYSVLLLLLPKDLNTSSTSLCHKTYWSVCLRRLNFDNSAYRYIMKEDEEEQEILPITSDFFFEVFPFNIVFRQVIPLASHS